MENKRTNQSKDELRPEYDFDYSKAARGKYYKRLLQEGSNRVMELRKDESGSPAIKTVKMKGVPKYTVWKIVRH